MAIVEFTRLWFLHELEMDPVSDATSDPMILTVATRLKYDKQCNLTMTIVSCDCDDDERHGNDYH